jgi:hypothetical protein
MPVPGGRTGAAQSSAPAADAKPQWEFLLDLVLDSGPGEQRRIASR